jgi:hypothetical protein
MHSNQSKTSSNNRKKVTNPSTGRHVYEDSPTYKKYLKSQMNMDSASSVGKQMSEKTSNKSSSSSSLSPFSKRNVFQPIIERFGDVSSIIISKFVNMDGNKIILEMFERDSNDDTKFKWNKKELDVILKHFVDTDSNTYNKIISMLSANIFSFLPYETVEHDFDDNFDDNMIELQRILYILKYFGKYRKFNLENFTNIYTGIHAYWEYIFTKNPKNERMNYVLQFIKNIFKIEYINENVKNKEDIFKLMLRLYKIIMKQCIRFVYQDFVIELNIDKKNVKAFQDCFLQKIGNMVNSFQDKHFKNRQIQEYLQLDIAFLTFDHNWRETGKYKQDELIFPSFKKIFFVNEEIQKKFNEHKQMRNIKYKLTDFIM